ncbi:RloB family protein [Streptomyces griseus]
MKSRRLHGSQKLSKSKNKRTEYRKILVATEGTKTEPQYFEGLASHLNAKAVRILSVKSVGVGKDPLRIVTEAARLRDREIKAGDGFDETWCVLDVDQHATLGPACREAKKLRIDVAISSPCFEVWLLWHYEEWTGWSEGKALHKRLKDKHGFCDKNIPRDFPYGNYGQALIRAGKCEPVKILHLPPNPHSSVDALVGRLESH